MTDRTVEPDAPPRPLDAAGEEPIAPQRRRRWPGVWSFGAAVAMLTAAGAALAVAAAFGSTGGAFAAVVLAFLAVVSGGIAVVLGLVAIFGRSARGWGVAGLTIGLLLNPLTVLWLLFGPLYLVGWLAHQFA